MRRAQQTATTLKPTDRFDILKATERRRGERQETAHGYGLSQRPPIAESPRERNGEGRRLNRVSKVIAAGKLGQVDRCEVERTAASASERNLAEALMLIKGCRAGEDVRLRSVEHEKRVNHEARIVRRRQREALRTVRRANRMIVNRIVDRERVEVDRDKRGV